MTTDFSNGTIEIHMPDDENIWMVSIKNFRYETIELPDECLASLTTAANAIVDLIEKHAKFHGDVDRLQGK
jgi:hypothetical protein